MADILADIININSFNESKQIRVNNLFIKERDFELFHILEITYEDEAPRKEALENVISSMQIDDINFIYLIVGSKEKTSFYLGVVKNKKITSIDIDDIANQILKANIEGNFRGSKVKRVSKNEKKEIQDILKSYKYIAEIDGVPNINEEAKNFQGVDRLVNIMSGDEFMLLIIADPLRLSELNSIEKELFNIYDKLTPLVKKSVQKSKSYTKQDSEVNSKSDTKSNSKSTTNSEADTKTKTDSRTTSISESESLIESNSSKQKNNTTNKNESKTISTTTTNTESASQTTSNSTTNSNSKSLNYTTQEGDSETINVEFEKKELEEWLKYIDDILLKRINYAKGKGAFISGVYLFANTNGKIKKLANSFISLYSGVEQNKVPLTYEFISGKVHKEYIYNFQLPQYILPNDTNQKQKMLLYSKYNMIDWFSTKELSVIASLPQKEVVGLRLKEEVEFGLNIDKSNDKKITLGKIVKSGNITDLDIDLSLKELNKHIFVTGVTGSGKTTTCQKLLFEANTPFLVIEPAKTEYRDLMQVDDVIVFTLGNENIAPFRLNPFEFFEGENISSRVDMIKAAIESAFDMEAAIPQIIESAIYSAYQKYGWDISTNKNYKYQDPFAKNINSFPTLQDVIDEVNIVVEQQGFDDRLKNDYIGSIKARLQGLMVGSKGFMLNTNRSFDFRELVDKKVVIELEEIKNPSEKSFIMGLILVNLNEAIKIKHKEDKNFKHITLIEEAHRLLSKYEAGDSLNKKRGVESFTDMLAEIRKYGESLIIVDQIPNKLTSEILKNTNTKIVHRIFAIDDKEAIGNTMALNEEQKEFLSRLETGRAVVFNQNFYNAIQAQITPLELNNNSETIKDSDINRKWLEFYRDILDLEDISLEELSKILEFSKRWKLLMEYESSNSELFEIYKANIHNWLQINQIDMNILISFLDKTFYDSSNEHLEEILNELKSSQTIGRLIKKIRKV